MQVSSIITLNNPSQRQDFDVAALLQGDEGRLDGIKSEKVEGMHVAIMIDIHTVTRSTRACLSYSRVSHLVDGRVASYCLSEQMQVNDDDIDVGEGDDDEDEEESDDGAMDVRVDAPEHKPLPTQFKHSKQAPVKTDIVATVKVVHHYPIICHEFPY